MFEQQSALWTQVSLSTLHSAPPHLPALQLRSQQSVAFAHAAPLPSQMSAHCVWPAWPSTGSQRELQQLFVGPSTQVWPGARQLFDGRQTPVSHRVEQQSVPIEQVSPSTMQPLGPSP
jgi:hypothetical protein